MGPRELGTKAVLGRDGHAYTHTHTHTHIHTRRFEDRFSLKLPMTPGDMGACSIHGGRAVSSKAVTNVSLEVSNVSLTVTNVSLAVTNVSLAVTNVSRSSKRFSQK